MEVDEEFKEGKEFFVVDDTFYYSTIKSFLAHLVSRSRDSNTNFSVEIRQFDD